MENEVVFKPYDIVVLNEEEKEQVDSPWNKVLGSMSEETLNNYGLEIRAEKHEHVQMPVGMVTETDGYSASVTWFNPTQNLKSAWFDSSELTVLGNAMFAAADAMAHPMGNNRNQSSIFK